jgi:hypothetical protein
MNRLFSQISTAVAYQTGRSTTFIFALLLATFRRKIRFLSLRTIAPRKTKPPGGDRRLEIV